MTAKAIKGSGSVRLLDMDAIEMYRTAKKQVQ